MIDFKTNKMLPSLVETDNSFWRIFLLIDLRNLIASIEMFDSINNLMVSSKFEEHYLTFENYRKLKKFIRSFSKNCSRFIEEYSWHMDLCDDLSKIQPKIDCDLKLLSIRIMEVNRLNLKFLHHRFNNNDLNKFTNALTRIANK